MPLVRSRSTVFVRGVLPAVLAATPCLAQPRTPAGSVTEHRADSAERAFVEATSETYLQLFRRALLPGPNGSIVSTETAVPIHQYFLARASDVPAPSEAGRFDLEFAAWGRLWPTDSLTERPFDGDVQTASARYRNGPLWARLGRQQVAGGAARFARFDGFMLGAAEPSGLFGEGYAGFTVLPRWDERPGYRYLGALEDDSLRYRAEALERRGHWLAGARFGYSAPAASASLSLHEQREQGGVARRNLGFDAGARPTDTVSIGASALLELDGRRFSDLRAFIDATPLRELDVGLEALRLEPVSLLSRQSVFSVFVADGYEELGATATLRVRRWLRFESAGYVQLYDAGVPGARGELTARLVADRSRKTVVRVTYARVDARENGYHSMRIALSRQFFPRLGSSIEAYGYFYDAPISGHSVSSVYASTLSYRALDALELLGGASLASSPYASLDAQALLRARYEFMAPPAPRQR